MKRISIVPVRELMLVVIISLRVSMFGPLPARAAAAGYSEFYIPGSTDQLFRILQDIDNSPELGNAFGVGTCATGIVPGGGVGGCNYMHNVVTVSVTADGTTIYYDHWENGYSTANAGDEVYLANQGNVLVFESANIQVPRSAGNTCVSTNPNGASTACYDGRDRIYVAGGAVAVARPSGPKQPPPSTPTPGRFTLSSRTRPVTPSRLARICLPTWAMPISRMCMSSSWPLPMAPMSKSMTRSRLGWT